MSRPILVLLIFLLVVTVYYPAIYAGILPADDQRLFDYLYSLEDYSLFDFFAFGSGYYYRPLLFITYIFDKEMWGPHESFMHLENILLHAGNSILIFFIAAELADRYQIKGRLVPLVAALFFGLHPLTTESVNWINGRTDLLAGFFLFCSLLFLLKGLSHHSAGFYSVAILTFFLAVLSKETALFAFPAALFLIYCWWREDADESGVLPRSGLRSVAPYLLLMTLPLAYFIVRFLALPHHDGGIDLALKAIFAGDYQLLDKGRVILKVFGFYCVKLVQPFPLNFAIVTASNWYVVPGIVGLLGCGWLLYRRQVVASLLLFSACTIAPALLVPLGSMAWTPLAERYLYMPLGFAVIAAVIALALVFQQYSQSKVLVPLLVFVLLAGSAWATWQRTLVWQDNVTLYADAVAKSPDFLTVRKDLAQELEKAGRIEEALAVYDSLPIPEGQDYSILSELSRARARAVLRKDVAGAVRQLESLGHQPGQPMYVDYLRLLLSLYNEQAKELSDVAEQRELNFKIIALTKDLLRYSGDASLPYRLGQLYLSVEDRDQALEWFEKAVSQPGEYQVAARKMAERLRAGQRNGS